MTNIGIYTNQQFQDYQDELLLLLQSLTYHKKNIFLHKSIYETVLKNDAYAQFITKIVFYDNLHHIAKKLDLLITIGGDGTILESIHHLREYIQTPVLGINSGRLGFLASINISEIEAAVFHLVNQNYSIENRSMIELLGQKMFECGNIALNEFTIHKLDTSSMISIELYINEQHVNTYWADGLIISTPTGSTAYSLSAGGPIIHPQSNSLVITPIAAHNLNIRPLVVPDNVILHLKVSGRSEHCMISMDHLSKAVPINSTFTIKKSKFAAKLLNLHSSNFYNTLKNKLLWGADKRN